MTNFVTALDFSDVKTGSRLLTMAESSRLGFAEIAETAAISAPSLYRALRKAGVDKGMGPVKSRTMARRVTRQLMYVAELANHQMVAMRLFTKNFNEIRMWDESDGLAKFDTDG